MVVTRRVPSPRSVRHLLQVASVSASVVGKRVLYVKHGRSASSRASPRRELCCVLERSNSVASERPRVPRRRPYRSVGCPAPDRLPLRTGMHAWYKTPKPPPPPLKPPETAVSQKCFTFSDPESERRIASITLGAYSCVWLGPSKIRNTKYKMVTKFVFRTPVCAC